MTIFPASLYDGNLNRDRHVHRESELKRMRIWLPVSQGKACGTSSLIAVGRTSPADRLNVDLQFPELPTNKSLLFKSPDTWSVVVASLEN